MYVFRNGAAAWPNYGPLLTRATQSLAAVEQLGPDGFDRSALVAKWTGRGFAGSTIYRRITAIIASGRPGAHVSAVVREHVAARAKVIGRDPASRSDSAVSESLARETIEKLDASQLRLSQISALDVAGIVSELRDCIGLAKEIMQGARSPDGRIRNPRLALMASEHLRRVTETCVKLSESAADISNFNKFTSAIFDVLAGESPDLCVRVLARLQTLTSAYAVPSKR